MDMDTKWKIPPGMHIYIRRAQYNEVTRMFWRSGEGSIGGKFSSPLLMLRRCMSRDYLNGWLAKTAIEYYPVDPYEMRDIIVLALIDRARYLTLEGVSLIRKTGDLDAIVLALPIDRPLLSNTVLVDPILRIFVESNRPESLARLVSNLVVTISDERRPSMVAHFLELIAKMGDPFDSNHTKFIADFKEKVTERLMKDVQHTV